MQVDDQIVRAAAKLRASVRGTSQGRWTNEGGQVKSKLGVPILTSPGTERLTAGPNAAYVAAVDPDVAIAVSHLMLDVMNNSAPQSAALLTCRALARTILQED